jgi:hypothetical protein
MMSRVFWRVSQIRLLRRLEMAQVGLKGCVVIYPARIRTWTKRAKISCATVTLPGNERFSNEERRWCGRETLVALTAQSSRQQRGSPPKEHERLPGRNLAGL